LLVWAVFQEIEKGEVVTLDPKFAPSTRNWTDAMPTLSVAEAVTVTTPLTVAPFAGDVTETEGVAADETVTFTLLEAAVLPAVFTA